MDQSEHFVDRALCPGGRGVFTGCCRRTRGFVGVRGDGIRTDDVSHACRAVSGQRPRCDRRTCERRFRSRQMGGPGADLAGPPTITGGAAVTAHLPCSTPFAIHDRPPRRCSLFHRRAADVPAAGVSRGPKGKPTPAAPGLYRCQHPFLLVRHRSVRGWAGAANPPIAEESSRQNPATGDRSQVTVRDGSHHNLFELFGVLAGLSLGARNY